MTNMTQNKELYTEYGEKWVMETNDFKYYMHLKRLNIPTKFTGKESDLVLLKNDILTHLNK